MLASSPFGLLSDFAGVTNQQIDPSTPSPSLAAGPANLIETTTDHISILDKGGTTLAAAGIDNPNDPSPDFFSPVDQHTAGYSVADTAALYDPFAQRFMVLTTESSASQARLLMAVSTSSHPLNLNPSGGSWNFYSVDATHDFGSGSAYLTAMKFAVDANYLYVTGTYDLFNSNAFAGVLVSRFDKTLGSRVDSTAPSQVTALTPVQNLDPSNNVPQVFVDAEAATGVSVWSLDSNGQLVATPTVVSGTTFTSHTTGARQFGTSLPLDTAGDRITSADGSIYADRITSAVERGGSIYAAHTVDVGGLATVRWYQVDATTDGLVQYGDVTDTTSGTRTLETYLPAVSVDSAGDLGITYTHSSTNDFAAFMVTVHAASDTTGATPVGTVVRSGDDSFKPDPTSNAAQPWGTSAGIAVDPSDGQTFWAYGEYAGHNSIQNAWGTWTTSFAAIQNDRFHQNGATNSTVATATNLGVAPGIHLTNLARINTTPTDLANYYYFELLRQTSIQVDLSFYRNQGDLVLEVDSDQASVDASGNRIDSLTPVLISHTSFNSVNALAQVVNNEVAQLTNLAPGRYYIKVYAANNTDTTNYNLSVDALDTSANRVFYVNDGSQANDYYALAPGDDANSGLSPYAPKATLQSILANYTLGPTDTVVIDTGTYGGNTIVLDAQHEGAVFAGSPGGSVFANINGNDQWDLAGSQQNTIYGLTFQGNYRGIYAYATSQPASGNDIRNNTFIGNSDTAIEIDGGFDNVIRSNNISGTGMYGVLVYGGGVTVGEPDDPSEVTPLSALDKNNISGRTNGIFLEGTYSLEEQGSVRGNVITRVPSFGDGSVGIYVRDGASTISGNQIQGFDTGVYGADDDYYPYSTAIGIVGNDVSSNNVGINSNLYRYGSTSSVSGNAIHDNQTGLEGVGTLGGADWTQANLIYNNVTGVNANSANTVQFNRIYDNSVGVTAGSGTTVSHNLIYRNTTEGILVNAAYNVDIESNTIYAPQGNGVQLQSSSSNVTLHNNILWAESGYDLYVATDSEQGFASDYNNLYSSGTGTIVHWQKDFHDLFDWQVEANYDNHSIGYTTLAPTLDNPLFVDKDNPDPALQDYHLQDASVPNRPISTSIDAGDPASLYNQEPSPNGGRIDLGAYGDTSQAAVSPASYVKIDYPSFYTDWQVNAGHSILWHTFNVTGNVSIDLYKQDPNDPTNLTLVTNIAVVPAANGFYGWTPQASNISPSTTDRYVIEITAANGGTPVSTQSREGFAIPAAGNTYYVNNPTSTANDYYTTAVGDNRHTGTTPQDPKANILPILHSYNVGPSDTVLIDSGDYVEVRNVVLSGNPAIGRGQGATFEGPNGGVTSTIPGVSFNSSTMTAILDRQNTYAGSTDVELNQGSFITLRYLTLTGAQQGLWVHNGSTNFTGQNLTATNNSSNGIRIEPDARGTVVDSLTAYQNGADGVSIATPIASLNNSIVHDNGGNGIDLSNTGSTVLERDQVYNNGTGINVYNYSGTTVIGDTDLTQAAGNLIHDNKGAGVYASGGGVLIAGNSVFNNATGLQLYGAVAEQNLIYGNGVGVADGPCNSQVISGNRIYNNTGNGIDAYAGDTIEQNVIYGNAEGIDASSGYCYYYVPFSGTITNNVVYGNTAGGIAIHGGEGATVRSNTVYQSAGDAVAIDSNSSGVNVRDNILDVGSGNDLNIANDSQSAFASDYNLLTTMAPGSGHVSLWDGIFGTKLQAWYYTSYNDKHSLTGDPLFVNAANGDFHLQSIYGDDHGGTLAPILNTATGLPVANPGTWVPNSNTPTDAAQSPAIDAGAPGDSFANEPSPNGNALNLGAYGNTAQASLSPSQYVTVTSPVSGDVFPIGEEFTLTWRSEDFSSTSSPSTVNIDLWQNGSFVYSIAAGAANTGSYDWLVGSNLPPNFVLSPGADYSIRITRTDNSAFGTSGVFTIHAPTHDFYVAPSTTPADTDANNDGLSVNTPKATIRAILETYDLETRNGIPNTIHVAAGTYNLTSDILVTARSEGVIIQGEGGLAIQNRGLSQYPVFHLVGANNVTLDSLGMTDGSTGVQAENSTGVTITNSQLYQDSTGASFDANSSGWNVQHDQFTNDSTGLSATGQGTATNGNMFNNDSSYGASASGPNTVISGNSATADGTGISAQGAGSTISDNNVSGSSYTGISASGTGTQITGNTVSGGSTGISASNGATVGGPATSNGNQVHGAGTGIYAYSGVTVQNNTVFNNSGTGIEGLEGGAVITNTVYNNAGDGISTNPCGPNNVQGNTVYHNAGVGIHTYSSDTVVGNDVYSNGTGIQGDSGDCDYTYVPYSGTIQNNLVYANSTTGIVINNAVGANVLNNTVYQQAGDAVSVHSSQNVTVKNNILSTQSSSSTSPGADIRVDNASEGGFVSDYNQLQWLGTALLGVWQGVAFDHWTDWVYQVGLDRHSLAQDQTPARGDPMFVNPAGSDGILGYSTAPQGPAQIIGDGAAGFSTTGTGWTTESDSAAYGGSFSDHAGSYSGDATASWTFGGLTPGDYEVAVTYVPGSFYNGSQWNYYYGDVPFSVIGDGGSTLATTDVYEGNTPSSFTEAGVGWQQLPGIFTITGNTLSVQMSDAIGYDYNYYRVNADAVLIQRVQGNGGADDNFHLQTGAPGIDAGDPNSPYSAEPTPNGGRINLGYDGDTSSATTSPTHLLQVLSPSGLEKLEIGQTVNVNYRTAGEAAGAPVKLEFSIDDGATWRDTGLTGTVGSNGTGTFSWTIPLDSTLETAGNSALVRVTVTSDNTQGVSPNAFQIANNNHDFYLSPTGDDTQSGKDVDHPMKTVAALLSAYTLTSADTVHFAAGTYELLQNAVLTSTNSGVHLQGPTTGQALLDRGDNNSQLYVFDLVGAANVTMDRLGIKGASIGILADAASSNLSITNSEIFDNSTGLSLAGDNTALTNNLIHDNTYGTGVVLSGKSDSLQSNQIYNSYTGISSSGAGAMIQNNDLHNNSQTSIGVTGAGSIVSGNQVHGNTGYSGAISASYYTDSLPADTIQVTNNNVYRNSGPGIYAYGNVVVSANQVHDNSGTGVSIYDSDTQATQNVVYSNASGIYATGGSVNGNRVFNNTQTGIELQYNASASNNQVYSNSIGIEGYGNYYAYDLYYSFSGQITNNLIYANTSEGVEIDGGNGAQVVNNTIYNPIGNAVVVQQSSHGTNLENNILEVQTGAAISVADDSQSGFHSDYNDLYATGGANVGHWQEHDYASLVDWFFAVGQDQHSLSADPKFIDPAGPDGILGYSNLPAGPATIIDDSNPGFSTTGTGWTTVNGIGDNNEVMDHVGSTAADATANWTFTGLTPGLYQVAVTYASGTYYDGSAYHYYYWDAPYTVLGDKGVSLGTTYIYQDSAPSSFKDAGVNWQSLPGLFGISGTTLTVSLSDDVGGNYDNINADAVRIQRIQGDGGLDDDFHLQFGSPAIDAGDPKSDYSAEPLPNGGRINLGFDGNTSAAQQSATEGVQVTSPSSFDKLQLGQTVSIAYHSFGVASGTTYTVELSTDGGADYQTLFTAAPAVDTSGNGSVSWTVPNDNTLLTTGTTALLRISPNDGNGIHGVSVNPFLIANAGHDYYLSPTGDDGNSGKTSDQPMYSLAAMASAYNFQPGDVIHVAAGNYSLARDVNLTAADSGTPGDPVTIQGPTTGAAVFDRGNTNGNVIDVNGATDIVIDHLTLQGGNLGVNATNGAARLTVSNSVLTHDAGGGISVDATSNAPQILKNAIDGITGYQAVYVAAPDAMISGNTINNNNELGVEVSGARDVVKANTIFSNSTGISSYGYGLSNADRIVISGNTLHNNTGVGISTSDNSLVSGNQVYSGSEGIQISGGEATQNTVYGNSYLGIQATGGLVDGNRVFNNNGTGIWAYYGADVSANHVYSNQLGIVGQGYNYYPNEPYTGQIVNNLVYANQVAGVQLNDAGSGAQVVNNTIYTPVGDALELNQGTVNVLLRNNILVVDAGYDVYVDGTSGAGLNSDYNLFSPGVSGSAGLFGKPLRTLANWQAATSQDAHSVTGDPQFVNPSGNDQVLGYTTDGGGYDGGQDDNFYLRYSSPAVNAGDNSHAPATDIEGQPRPAASKGAGGTVDIGAYEFRGSVADGNSTPPTVTATTPSVVYSGGSTIAHISQIVVTFSEDVNPIDASAPTEYNLLSTTNANLVYTLTPEAYVPGSKQVVLDINLPVGETALPPDTYQFTVFSNFTKSVHDLEGTALAGNSPNGFVSTFTVLPLISLTPITPLVTSDQGAAAQFQVVLNQQPAGDVTVPLHIVNASDGVTRGTLSTPSVTFTPADYNMPQTVTVTGVDDHIDEGASLVTYSVVTDPATSSDPAFNGLKAGDLTITAQNDDVAGVTVTAAPNLTTTESGGQVTFTVVLNTIPQDPVSIAASYAPLTQYASEPVHAIVTPAQLNFDASNWNVPQTVTVTGQNDFVDEGHNTPYNVQLASPTSTDKQYAALAAQNVPVTAINDDHAGIIVTPTSGLVTNADGGTDTFTVQLQSQPTSYVIIPVRSDNRTLGLASPTRLFFDPTNWNVPQTVTMTGVDDQDIDSQVDRLYNGELGFASSVDPIYNGMLGTSVSVTNHDVDTPMINVSPTSGLQTTKTGGTANFAMSLNLQPVADVTVHLYSSNTGEGTVSPSDVTFTLDNFDQPHVVTVTGVNDGTLTSVAYTIIADAAVSTDSRFNGLVPSSVAVTNISVYQPPVAVDDSYNVTKNITLNEPATGGVLANDIDPENNPMTAVQKSSPQHGMLTLNSDGSFTYVPDHGYVGMDSFTYLAHDAYADSHIATVTFTVVNAVPVAVNDTYSASNRVETDVSASAGVLLNDTDIDGDALTAVLDTTTSHGTLTLNPDGSFSYVPTPGYVGDDSFTYHANDGMANSNEATVTIHVYTPPQVTLVAVNSDPTQVQRSQVLNLQVTFNESVNLGATPANAFQLVGPDGQQVNLSAAVTTNSSGDTVATLTFLSGPDTYKLSNGQYALVDGRYQLTVLKGSVLDSNSHPMDASVVDQFWRLFGDARGTGYVDNRDYFLFVQAYGSHSGSSKYVWYFDDNMDGMINSVDFAAFKSDYYKHV
jgi:parallel beta-helix repeat protein/VCBS repeat-containing protein